MNGQHTPGPWFVVKRHPRSFARAITTTPDDPRGDIANVLSGLGSKDVESDAALIAEAPGMLFALRRAALALAFAAESSPAMQDDYEAVSAAIAKATGAAP